MLYPLLTAVASFAHESGVFLPVALGVAEAVRAPPRASEIGRRILAIMPSFLPVLALVVIKRWGSHPLSPNLSPLSFQVTTVRVWHAVAGLAIPGLPLHPGWIPDPAALAMPCGFDLVVIAVLLAVFSRGRKYLGAYLVVPLSLAITGLHVALQDRFLYLPSALLSSLVAGALLAAIEAARGTSATPFRVLRSPWRTRSMR